MELEVGQYFKPKDTSWKEILLVVSFNDRNEVKIHAWRGDLHGETVLNITGLLKDYRPMTKPEVIKWKLK